MLALVMAGGKGERLGLAGVEKPLLTFAQKPLIAHLVSALAQSQIEDMVIVTSPHTPRTTRWARDSGIYVIEAPGLGFIDDYQWAMKKLDLHGAVMIISADLPLMNPELIDKLVERQSHNESPALGVYISSSFFEEVGVSPDLALRSDNKFLIPTGINIVDADLPDQMQQETKLVIDDESLVWNINTKGDLERLKRKTGEREKSADTD